jgi:hypothetical protein
LLKQEGQNRPEKCFLLKQEGQNQPEKCFLPKQEGQNQSDIIIFKAIGYEQI